jgi:phosphoribosylformylglycinamidine cyclo-ligase
MSEDKKEKALTYADSGVDIEEENKAIALMLSKLKKEGSGFCKPMGPEGHFTGLLDFGEYALSLCTDSVGTKVLIANALKKWDTVGIDCIAMNVNDMICIGAKPIAFVDFLAVEKTTPEFIEQIGVGLAKGADLSDMYIIGGETATLPGVINGFELAGTCLGCVKKENIIAGDGIKPGDSIVGLASSGVHSNGYSLVRKILETNRIGYNDSFPNSDKTWGEVLITPTRIYVREILDTIKEFKVHGLSNITGGGLRKVSRINKKVKFVITDPVEPQIEFKELQKLGNVEDKEMYQTFNMGMGFCLIVDKKDAEDVIDLLKGKVEAKIVGEVVEGEGVTLPKLNLKYD